MATMSSTSTSEILQASDSLPGGAMLVIPNVPWEDYDRLLQEMEEHSRRRISYDTGRLEIVSPLPEHGKYADFLTRLLSVYAEIHDMELEGCGNATWKRKSIGRGVEADACFFVRNAGSIIGKRKIDLESDPPPDIAIEIDITRTSKRKFPIYAALGVPEVWIYDGQQPRFFALTAGDYENTAASQFFPGLTEEMLVEAINLSKTAGQTKALQAFRQRLMQ